MGSVKDAGVTVTISMGLTAYPLLSTATYITYLSRMQLNFTLQSTVPEPTVQVRWAEKFSSKF